MTPPIFRPARALPSGQKLVKVGGTPYVIRRINWMDFVTGRAPAIIQSALVGRNPEPAVRRMSYAEGIAEVAATLRAGIVDPPVVPANGIKQGVACVTVEEMLHYPWHAMPLYKEIVIHSLNRYSGLRGFIMGIRLRVKFAFDARAAKKAYAATQGA